MQKRGVWDGTLSLEDFNMAATALCNRWKEVCSALPQWKWIPCVQTAGASCNVQTEGYLSLENVCHLDFGQEHVGKQSFSEKEEPFDNASLMLSDTCETHVYDFHIVYSFSYKVPVLYFRGYQSGGQPLGLDDIQNDLPKYSLSIMRESKWTFMTQEDHPHLHRPWLMLHPCGTSDWMRLLLGDSDNQCGKEPEMLHYLLAWISVVGQAVGLRAPLELRHISLLDSSLPSNLSI